MYAAAEINHVVNQRRRDFEDRLTFDGYGRGLDGAPNLDLPDSSRKAKSAARRG